MKTEIKNLSELPLNRYGIVQELKCDGNIRRRLLDMGLVKETKIKPVLVSPSKDPRAFEVRGSIIAIRKEDAERIYIKLTWYVKSGIIYVYELLKRILQEEKNEI